MWSGDTAPHDHDTRAAGTMVLDRRMLGDPGSQNRLPVFGAPDYVVLQIEYRVRAMPVFRHPPYSRRDWAAGSEPPERRWD